MLEIAVLGIDLGKNSCSVVGLDASGRVALRRRLHRDGVLKLATSLPGCMVAMEACCGAHHLGRRLREVGHEVRLMSPEYVRPYVKAQKNDDRDAEAIAEAAGFEVRVVERGVSGKEKRVDTGVVIRICRDAYLLGQPGRDRITLVAGDGDYEPMVRQLVQDGFEVTLLYWSHTSRELQAVASRF
jgi:hypothetical protein